MCTQLKHKTIVQCTHFRLGLRKMCNFWLPDLHYTAIFQETYQHLNELLRQQFFGEFTKSKNEKSKKNKGIMGDVYSIENRPWVVKQVRCVTQV